MLSCLFDMVFFFLIYSVLYVSVVCFFLGIGNLSFEVWDLIDYVMMLLKCVCLRVLGWFNVGFIWLSRFYFIDISFCVFFFLVIFFEWL